MTWSATTPRYFLFAPPLKFPDFIYTQKRNPATNLKDADMFWDFLSLTPESMHQVTIILFSDHGTPKSYRHMNGYSSHTFKWYNEKDEYYWVKYHFKTEQGNQTFTGEEAGRMKSIDPDSATRDLYEAINRGQYPSWRLEVLIMPPEQAKSYRFDPFDITKVWPHADFPPGCWTHGPEPQSGKLFCRRRAVGVLAGKLCARHRPFSGQDAARKAFQLPRYPSPSPGGQLPSAAGQFCQSVPNAQLSAGRVHAL